MIANVEATAEQIVKGQASGTLFNNSITVSRREVFGTPDKYVALSVGI